MLSARIDKNPGSTNSKPAVSPPLGAVQEPADVSGELLRLRSRQQHAVVECVQKSVLAHPAFFLYENTVHHRDLPGGSAERLQGDPHPHPESLAVGDAVFRRGVRADRLSGYVHGFSPSA
jgi:hypothetical protein